MYRHSSRLIRERHILEIATSNIGCNCDRLNADISRTRNFRNKVNSANERSGRRKEIRSVAVAVGERRVTTEPTYSILWFGAAPLRNDRRTRSHVGARVTCAYSIPYGSLTRTLDQCLRDGRYPSIVRRIGNATCWRTVVRGRKRKREREKERNARRKYRATS